MTGSTDTGFFTARSLVTTAVCATAALALAGFTTLHRIKRCLPSS